jgi:hypothetical protein
MSYLHALQSFSLPGLGPHAKLLFTNVTAHFYAFCHALHECTYYHISSSCTSDIMIIHCQTYNLHKFRALYNLIQKDDINKTFLSQTQGQTQCYAGW